MTRQLNGYRRWLTAFVMVALPALVLAGPSAHAAGPAGCTVVSHALTGVYKSCTYKSTTAEVEVVAAGEDWFVHSSKFGPSPCAFGHLGAQSVVCFSGGSKAFPSTITAEAVGSAVTVRDLPLLP